ncbi:MAG: PilZ domain-containing protein [Pyrinomonadaceae bacterium]
MQERRGGERFSVSFPIRLEWKNENGEPIVEEGLTENVGRQGTLIHLPRKLPVVGSKVNLTVTENAANEVTVTAQVLRLERNAAHPQVALMLLSGTRNWEKHVWKYAGNILAAQQPDDYDDWN